ncbi:MAG: hypothetical protein KBC90_11290 [Spirochaetes bacterium]|nr:hypothetical protein [Spirochaetota bacterium]HOD14406.1 hypothetical protein [Spirochaetota bacterium]HPG50043.1 hypothetical protein [Spirochaetota bacterium]
MKELDRLMVRFVQACRTGHRYMTEDRFGPGMNRFNKLSGLGREIVQFGREGVERLFALAEGEDLLLAVHAAVCLYAVDPGRCEKALMRIMEKDRGFFGNAARMQLEMRKHGADWMLKKYMRLPGKGVPRRSLS